MVQPNFRAPDPTDPGLYGRVYSVEEFLNSGHDGRKISDLLNIELINEQMSLAQQQESDYKDKIETAEIWDQTYPSQVGSNYYKSKEYYISLLENVQRRKLFLSSYIRVINNLNTSRASFFDAIHKGKDLNLCNALLQ